MVLDRVTITGADESIGDPIALLPLTREFPFVEWGMLASHSSSGFAPRYPSLVWIERLKELAGVHPMKLSLHVCGRWVRDLLVGTLTIPSRLIYAKEFQRIQLNFHAERTPCAPEHFFEVLCSVGPKQFIFQIDGAGGNRQLEAVRAIDERELVSVAPLFDLSGGAGLLPAEWPKTSPRYSYHGYAGGLGPQNLEEQIPRIAEAADDTRIWIDMETHVRSSDDREFDLAKVRRCLEICAPFVIGAQ